eukprot:5090158-Prymnesium_polylepis.1
MEVVIPGGGGSRPPTAGGRRGPAASADAGPRIELKDEAGEQRARIRRVFDEQDVGPCGVLLGEIELLSVVWQRQWRWRLLQGHVRQGRAEREHSRRRLDP